MAITPTITCPRIRLFKHALSSPLIRSSLQSCNTAVPDVLRGRSGWLSMVCGRQSQAADVAIGQNADNARIIFDCHSESADNDRVGMRDLNRTAVIHVDEEALKWFGVNQRFDLFVHRLRPSFGG